MVKTFKDKVEVHCKAGFGGIWIKTDEAAEVSRTVLRISNDNSWELLEWDAAGSVTADAFFGQVLERLSPQNEQRTLIVVHNPEKFIENFPEVAQMISNVTVAAKQSRANLIVVAATFDVPAMLQRAFTVLDHDLPDKDELRVILDQMSVTVEDTDAVIDAASGLTRMEAEDAFALSFVQNDQTAVKAKDVWKVKAREMSKNGALDLYEGDASFDQLCGLTTLKNFCTRSAGKEDAKGVLLLGVPGAGKSQFAKALGNAVGLPTISMDFGAMMGSLVGQTEERLRRSLQAVERMAPAVLFVDEIEKSLSGASSSNDSGVSQRMLGTLLTWLNDRDSGVYFVGTCNDIEQLSSVSAGAFTRAERFDGIFYIGLPSEEQRQAMWNLYVESYGLDVSQDAIDVINDEGWTGAEIKSCCRLAKLLDVDLNYAATMVVPVCKTAEAAIDKLESWSHGRALDANEGGIYVSKKFHDPHLAKSKSTSANHVRRAL